MKNDIWKIRNSSVFAVFLVAGVLLSGLSVAHGYVGNRVPRIVNAYKQKHKGRPSGQKENLVRITGEQKRGREQQSMCA